MKTIADPVELVIATALNAKGIKYQHEAANGLDFYLPDADVYIECKRFHSDRIGEQMKRAENVIVIQGMTAAQFFAKTVMGEG